MYIHKEFITFGNLIYNGTKSYTQEILFRGEHVGELSMREGSLLNPISESYTFSVLASEEAMKYTDDTASTLGFVYISCDSLEKFIELHNHLKGAF